MSFVNRIETLTAIVAKLPLAYVQGHVTQVRDHSIKACLMGAKLGAICEIARQNLPPLTAEVVALAEGHVILTPFETTKGLEIGASVSLCGGELSVPVCDELLGRTVDTFLRPIDGIGLIAGQTTLMSVKRESVSSMSRPIISTPFETGLRAIDGMTLLGVGQRMGVFGPPGTGKTSLMGMLASNCNADVVVIALVGERGREVRELVEDVLPAEIRDKVVVVAATSDRPPIERSLCALSATTVAEYFRDTGRDVFLLVDSLTRTARAMREIGLAAGEAPVRRGYPASVYPALPAIIERAGRASSGSITAMYTVLTEGQIESDPIAEEVKSLTDGHLILSREVAERGHFPAIDVRASLSRSMNTIAETDHLGAAARIRSQLAKYAEIEILLQMGEYTSGGDAEADEAIANIDQINAFLRQTVAEHTSLSETISALEDISQ